jgi:hypothetical protein
VPGFVEVTSLAGHDGTVRLSHLRWGRHADLLLTPAVGLDGVRGLGVALYFGASDVDEIVARARRSGAAAGTAPRDTFWNTREVELHDPDGYRLVFTAPRPEVVAPGGESFAALTARLGLVANDPTDPERTAADPRRGMRA